MRLSVLMFERMDVPAKTILLRKGEVSRRMFQVEKECFHLSRIRNKIVGERANGASNH